jgi:hypothetical protein
MKKIFQPTVVDFNEHPHKAKILALIGKEVTIEPNHDRSKIKYGRYKGQYRWQILEVHRDYYWFPCEDFKDVLVLTAEEENKMNVIIKESLELPVEI